MPFFQIQKSDHNYDTLYHKPLNVFYDNWCAERSVLALTYSSARYQNDFLDDLLVDHEKVAVLTYDK
jgi:hypothetical protein